MDLELLERIKRIAVIALVSDDILMEKLVLKGGNAINIIHNLSSRASIDLDYSMKGDFSVEERNDVENRIKRSLETTFKEHGFQIIDFKFSEKPEKIDEQVRDFWGGYEIEFKILEIEKYNKFNNIEDARRNAIVIGSKNSTKYSIEISKYEFVDKKSRYSIDGYTLFAYTPEMIICEKIRALCQQVPDYKEIVKSITPKSRARDFFDIYTLINHFRIDLTTKENIELLKSILESKNVPIDYLARISECKELHEESFAELKDTLKPSETLMPFESYFDFLIKLTERISTKIQGH
ncbi:MAG: nucleotidyl transferase AbiEii/AbiGii toxin family protein [Bacteroidales bacterium]|nr:nucleotidyl transferase AbiEii/AbiGii toxin family protein [Bacteroidales bacterium]